MKIVSDQRRTTKDSKLIIKNASSVLDSGDYLCRIDSISAMGGSQFGQIIQLRGTFYFSSSMISLITKILYSINSTDKSEAFPKNKEHSIGSNTSTRMCLYRLSLRKDSMAYR